MNWLGLKRTVSPLMLGACVCATLAPWGGTAVGGTASLPRFSADEVRAILSHGPWPVPPQRDPSNRVSGKPEAIDLGTQLFFDSRLSSAGTVSCGSCHVPDRNWTDNLHRGAAIGEVDRNTPTLMNIRLGRWFGWDGAADSLWAQSIRPMLDPRELGANARHVAELVRRDEQLACRYRKAYGTPPSATDDEAVLVDVAKALAAFQETLQSGRTPFDEFRDALARGEAVSDWRYSEPAQRGLKVFIGKGACSSCHTGPNFTNGEFHDTGLASSALPGKPVDPGRQDGITKVRDSRFNLLGRYNDDPSRSGAARAQAAAATQQTFGQFKVPSLRNNVLTAPYGHDGRVATLAEVVAHYAGLDLERLQKGEKVPKPLALTANEQSDLVVFLESLSTFTNPWRPDDGGRCE